MTVSRNSRKVTRRAAVAMLGSGIGFAAVGTAGSAPPAPCPDPKKDINVCEGVDPNDHEPMIHATATCPRLLSLLRAGIGDGRIDDATNKDMSVIVTAIKKKNDAKVLREHAFVIFGLKRDVAQALQKQIGEVLNVVSKK